MTVNLVYAVAWDIPSTPVSLLGGVAVSGKIDPDRMFDQEAVRRVGFGLSVKLFGVQHFSPL